MNVILLLLVCVSISQTLVILSLNKKAEQILKQLDLSKEDAAVLNLTKEVKLASDKLPPSEQKQTNRR